MALGAAHTFSPSYATQLQSTCVLCQLSRSHVLSTTHIESGENLAYVAVDAKNDLHVTCWVLTCNRDCIFGSYARHFLENRVPNFCLNLLDLVLCFLLRKTIEEKVHVRSWG